MIDLLTATYGVIGQVLGTTTPNQGNPTFESRVYEDSAPQDPVFPYAVYTVISAPEESTFTETVRRVRLQIVVVDDAPDSSTVLSLLDSFETAIKGAGRYAVGTGGGYAVLVGGVSKTYNEVIEENESYGWQGAVDFDLMYVR